MKPSSTLLVFATLKEAESSIELLSAKLKYDDPSLHLFEGGALLITGMGALAAGAAVARLAQNFELIWNLGIAGALSKDLSIGEIVEVGSVAKWKGGLSLSAHSLSLFERAHPVLGTGGLRLLTSDYPVHSKEIGKPLSREADLLDMEGYGIAFAAIQAGKPWRITKRISDLCAEDGPSLIPQELPKAARELAAEVAQVLSI